MTAPGSTVTPFSRRAEGCTWRPRQRRSLRTARTAAAHPETACAPPRQRRDRARAREHADPAGQGIRNRGVVRQAPATVVAACCTYFALSRKESSLGAATSSGAIPLMRRSRSAPLARLAADQGRNFSKREPPTSLEEEGRAHATLSVAMESDALRMSSRHQTGRTASDRKALS